ncbi:MAG: hypothetical protein ABR962_11620 [Candidatus Bathyarchaeia archaeon]|jgi:hypothetical protein
MQFPGHLPKKQVYGKGYNLDITVCRLNCYMYIETTNVTAHGNSTTIASQEVALPAAG